MTTVHRYEFPGESGIREFSDRYLARHFEMESSPDSVLRDARGLKSREKKELMVSLKCQGCWFPNIHLMARRSEDGILQVALIGEKVGLAIGVQEYDILFFESEGKLRKRLERWHQNYLNKKVARWPG